MSYTDLDTLEPIPGDLVMALTPMRSWESEDVRGTGGTYIQHGETALVLATWMVGTKVRLKLVRDDRMRIFSCQHFVVRRNWKVVMPAPRLPTFGCP